MRWGKSQLYETEEHFRAFEIVRKMLADIKAREEEE